MCLDVCLHVCLSVYHEHACALGGQKRTLDPLQQESDGCEPHGAGEANLDPLQEQLVLLAEKHLVLPGEAVFLPFIMQASYVGSYKSSITHTAKMGRENHL